MRQNTLVIILTGSLLVTGYFLYKYLSEKPRADAESIIEAVHIERLAEYQRVKNLRPDLSIFADPFFKALFSPSQTLGSGGTPPQIKPGRPNPFVPF